MSITNGLFALADSAFQKFTYLPLTSDNFRSALDTTLHRQLIRMTNNSHPSSQPYLSGDTFAHLADHALNEGFPPIDPLRVKKNDVIFVNVKALHYYFRVIHSQITQPYILITHNGDHHIDQPQARYCDKKIIHWFAQNVAVRHPKISPIPIGLENLLYFNHGTTRIFDELKKSLPKPTKMDHILVDFSLHTNRPIREPIYDILKKQPLADFLSQRLSAVQYLQKLATYAFVASPPGNGLDCHRTWEALYLGVTPIVQRSVATEAFAQMGFPLLVVTNWSDVARLRKRDLQAIYQQLWQNFDTQSLYLPYWRSRIYSFQMKTHHAK